MGDKPLIPEVFPADDSVARFVLTLCMARNDVIEVAYLSGHFNDKKHPLGNYAALLTWAHLLEAMKAVGDWKARYPEVREFLAQLPREVRDAMKDVNKRLTEVGQGEHHIARNTFFHYPAPLIPQKSCEGVSPEQCVRTKIDPSKSGDDGLRLMLETQLKERPCVIQVQPDAYAKLPSSERDRDNFNYTFAAETRLEVAARGFGGDMKKFGNALTAILCALAPFSDFADGCLKAHLWNRGIAVESMVEYAVRDDM